MEVFPGCVARREGRGERGARSCGGDSSREALNGGNGGRRRVRVSVGAICFRVTEEARERESQGRERRASARSSPYPSGARHRERVEREHAGGIGIALGRYSRRGERRPRRFCRKPPGDFVGIRRIVLLLLFSVFLLFLFSN